MYEKNIKSSNNFLNILHIFDKNSSNNYPNNKIKSESKQNYLSKPTEYIEKLPTYEKIRIMQILLKEIILIKERFEKNKIIMLERIEKNCKEYYNNQIGMKAIYDYCRSNNPEKYYNYVLVQNNEDKFGKKNYEIIHKIIFLIRNNNDILLNLISNCPKNSFDQFADFLVNFFFNNTIDSSFNEEELIMIIYLILEKYILNEDINIEEEKGENFIYTKLCLIHYIFKYLTRKPDVRSFTYTILFKYIIQFEEYNESLSIDTKILKRFNNISKRRTSSINIKFNDNRNKSLSLTKENNLEPNDVIKTFTYSSLLENNQKRNIEDILDNSDEDSDFQKESDINNIEIDPFFKDNNITLEFLQKKFSEYEQKNENDNVTLAMRSFIFNNINDINKSNEEIFSNNTKILNLKKYGNEIEYLNEKIKLNYNMIIKCIDDIINTLEENILSLPYIIKSINSILYILVNEKYSKEKLENTEYKTLIFLSHFLIGNIIIPLISNPYFNGIITKGVLSKISKDNLEIISKILTQMISGKLFSNEKEYEYTIFNKYIIETLPKIFNIINKINKQKNFKLSHCVRNLINSYGNPNRNLNFNFFEEIQENIQQQNICFSWIDLIILIDIIKISKDLDKIDIYQKNQKIFEQFLEMKSYFYDEYNGNNIDAQTDFFLFNKIIYSPYLSKLIDNLLEDNFDIKLNKKEENNVFLFKKFFAEILTFINKLNENISKKNPKELFLNEDERGTEMYIKKRYNEYLQIYSDKDISNEPADISISSIENQLKDDMDFKSLIFPNIIETIKNELAHNIDTITAKKIAFYSSYLQLHIDDLENKYKENNYSLLFMEIIKKLESKIEKINSLIINQFYLKVKDGSKLNMIIRNNFLQTKKMEKCICIKYLFDKLNIQGKLNIIKDDSGKITKIKYEKITTQTQNIRPISIQSFINNFPDCRKLFKNEEDIIDSEENIELDVALNAYFHDMKNVLKNENIMERYSKEEFDTILFELENYVLYKLYTKLFPSEQTKKDIIFYKKCCRLNFIKPEALIKDKKAINEKLWQASIILINELDAKFTPVDKVEKFGKAFGILQNSLTFSSGKNDLGIDDTIPILIYVMIKAKPKNIFSNSKYCQLFLNPELSKRMYGILLSQIEMIKNIVFNMKYTDLIGVSEEEFGKDDEE